MAVLEIFVFLRVAAYCLAFSHYVYHHKKEPSAIAIIL
jgi:hypothetical protein